MHAEALIARPNFLDDVARGEGRVGPGQAAPHHGGAKVLAVHAADRNGSAVAVRGDRLTLHPAVFDQTFQRPARRLAGPPAVGAALVALGGIDAVQTERLTALPQRVAVDDDLAV